MWWGASEDEDEGEPPNSEEAREEEWDRKANNAFWEEMQELAPYNFDFD